MDTFKNKFRAFTLAEVLITLGIIGVVAAMTLPTLIQRQQEKATVVSLKKAYTILSQAYLMAIEKDGTPDNWGLGGTGTGDPESANAILEKFKPYLKSARICKVQERSCFNEKKYLELDGVTESDEFTNGRYAAAKLPDGTVLTFYAYGNGSCVSNWGTSKALQSVCGSISVDINGAKKPNQIGVDAFSFLIIKYGIIPHGAPEMTIPFKFDTACRDRYAGYVNGWGSNGTGCAAWVIYNENMDYLHCNDLAWDGKTKCSK